ncbi:MAG: ABC-type transport auxiliary lipoprotein family protein [Acidobacteriota bacterium]
MTFMRPQIPRVVAGLVFLALGLALTACGSAPSTRYYLLAPPAMDGMPAEKPAGQRLGVETFAVDPPYDQSRLVYRIGEGAGEVGFYEHHRWAAEPGRLVSTALAAGLRHLDGLATAEPASVVGNYDLILSGRVVSLEEVDLPDRQVARLALDLKLYSGSEDTLLWSGFLTAENGGTAADASDIMGQMQEAFDDLLRQLQGELGPAVKAKGEAGG